MWSHLTFLSVTSNATAPTSTLEPRAAPAASHGPLNFSSSSHLAQLPHLFSHACARILLTQQARTALALTQPTDSHSLDSQLIAQTAIVTRHKARRLATAASRLLNSRLSSHNAVQRTLLLANALETSVTVQTSTSSTPLPSVFHLLSALATRALTRLLRTANAVQPLLTSLLLPNAKLVNPSPTALSAPTTQQPRQYLDATAMVDHSLISQAQFPFLMLPSAQTNAHAP